MSFQRTGKMWYFAAWLVLLLFDKGDDDDGDNENDLSNLTEIVESDDDDVTFILFLLLLDCFTGLKACNKTEAKEESSFRDANGAATIGSSPVAD